MRIGRNLLPTAGFKGLLGSELRQPDSVRSALNLRRSLPVRRHCLLFSVVAFPYMLRIICKLAKRCKGLRPGLRTRSGVLKNDKGSKEHLYLLARIPYDGTDIFVSADSGNGVTMERKWLYYAGLIIVAAIWGANFGISRLAMDTFDPALFSFLRFGLAVPFFFILLKIREGSVGVPFKTAMQLMAIGLFGVTGLEVAVMYSIKYTTLANASLLNVAPWPIFAALFAPLFFREAISGRLIVGGIAAIFGVSLVIIGGGAGIDLSSRNMLGNALAFAVSIVGALFNLACMPLMKRYSALRVSAWFILFGTLFMFPLTLGSWGKVDWAGLTAANGFAVGYNVILCTVVAFIVWNSCMFKIGAARSNFFRYVVPAAAVAAGYLLFDEQITLWQIAGALSMAAGLIWISLEKKA